MIKKIGPQKIKRDAETPYAEQWKTISGIVKKYSSRLSEYNIAVDGDNAIYTAEKDGFLVQIVEKGILSQNPLNTMCTYETSIRKPGHESFNSIQLSLSNALDDVECFFERKKNASK